MSDKCPYRSSGLLTWVADITVNYVNYRLLAKAFRVPQRTFCQTEPPARSRMHSAYRAKTKGRGRG